MKQEGNCTVIAFYDLGKTEVKKLFEYLEQFFIDHDHPPLRAEYSFLDIGSKSKKTQTFKHVKKILEERNYEKVENFAFGHRPEGGDDSLDAKVRTLYVEPNSGDLFYLYFHNDIISHDWGFIEKLAKDIRQFLHADYGIGFQREFSKGPGYYVAGVIVGLPMFNLTPEQKKERKSIGDWWRSRLTDEKYHLGLLRDIYPMNFLTQPHLANKVGSQTLKDWIEEDSKERGTLNSLTKDMHVWHVPEDKIESVREALRPYNFILCI